MSAEVLFSHRAKAEAASGITGRRKCDTALAGILLFSREVNPIRIVFCTENPDVRDLFARLVLHAAGAGKLSIKKEKRVPKPALYTMKITDPKALEAVYSRAGIDNFDGSSLGYFRDIPSRLFGAFAAGVFLSCGTVVEPRKGYHLEFVTQNENICRELSEMFEERLEITGGVIKRRSKYVLYFKESEHIEDILTLIGAPHASLELMNVKIYKDLRNHANRATNCDTANLGKQNRSSQKQIEAIKAIKSAGIYERLSSGLKTAAELRLANPDMSLSELADNVNPPMSRSGLNHRLQRLIEIAEDIKNNV